MWNNARKSIRFANAPWRKMDQLLVCIMGQPRVSNMELSQNVWTFRLWNYTPLWCGTQEIPFYCVAERSSGKAVQSRQENELRVWNEGTKGIAGIALENPFNIRKSQMDVALSLSLSLSQFSSATYVNLWTLFAPGYRKDTRVHVVFPSILTEGMDYIMLHVRTY